MSFCPSCGLQGHGRFCTRCGTGLAGPPVEEATTRVPVGPGTGGTDPTQVLSGPAQVVGSGAPAPRRGRRRAAWVLGATVLAVLAGGALAAWVLYFSKLGGADTPQAAVVDVVQALEDGDVVQAALLVSPDEVDGLADVVSAYEDKVDASGLDDGTSVTGSLTGVSLSVRDLEVSTEEIGPDLAKVTLESGVLVVDGDLGPAADLLGLGGDVAPPDEIDLRGLTVVDTYGEEQAPFVMVVRRNDGWYVSPLFTAGEYSAVLTGAPRSGDGSLQAPDGADSPEAAGQALLDGVVTAARTGSFDALAGALPPHEAAFVRTYASDLGGQLLAAGAQVDITRADLDVSELDDGQVLLRPSLVELTASDESSYVELSVDGECATGSEDGGERERVCLDELGVGDLLSGLGVVAVEVDGRWVVSATATAAHLAATVVDRLTEADVVFVASGEGVAGWRHLASAGTAGLDQDIEVPLAPTSLTGSAVARLDLDVAEAATFSVECESGTCDVRVLDAAGEELPISCGEVCGYTAVAGGARAVVVDERGSATVSVRSVDPAQLQYQDGGSSYTEPEPAPEPPFDPDGTSAPGAPAADGATGLCGTDSETAVVAAAAAQTRGPVVDGVEDPYWVWDPGTASGNYDECATLSAVNLDTTPTTLETPMHVVFFHEGVYQGTGTYQAYPLTYVDVGASTDDTVVVSYQYPTSGDPDDAYDGYVTIRYQWQGDGVVMLDELPAAMVEAFGS